VISKNKYKKIEMKNEDNILKKSLKFKKMKTSNQKSKIVNCQLSIINYQLSIVLLLLLACSPVLAQPPQFSQYYATPLHVAPSFAGNSLGSRAFFNFRDQWARIPGSYITYSAAIDNNFYALNSGFGLVAMHDVAGSARYGTTSAKGLYSYRFNFTDDWRMRPGIGFSYTQRGIFGRTIYPDQISITGEDPTSIEPPVKPYNYFDATSSVVVYNSRMWFGLCVDRLLRPNTSINRLDARAPMYWQQFGGYILPMKSYVGKPSEEITLHYLFKAFQNLRQLDVGVNWYHRPC